MFGWFMSVLLLFGYGGKGNPVSSVDLDGGGNRHVAPADDPQSNPTQPPDTDGRGGGG